MRSERSTTPLSSSTLAAGSSGRNSSVQRCRDAANDVDACGAHLDAGLERRERLGPETVSTSVPEEPRRVGDADERRRVRTCLSEATRKRQAVREEAARVMTGSAGDLTVRRETAIEEERMAELGGPRILREAVAR